MSEAPVSAVPAGSVHRLRFPQLGREVLARGGETILAVARRCGVRIVGACGGRGSCGSCVVQVLDGRIQRTGAEADAGASGTGGRGVRACQARPLSDCVLEISARSLAPVVRAEVGAAAGGEPLPFAPLVTRHEVTVPEATLAAPQADAERLLQVLAVHGPLTLDLTAARALPARVRAKGGRLAVALREGEVIDCAARGARTLGLAVDLGTTNVAAFLVDLADGRLLASLGLENPQVAWGGDLISRINHAHRNPAGAAELGAVVIAGINALAQDLCRDLGVAAEAIVDVAVCGNTAMQHLFAGWPVDALGRAPFVATMRAAADYRARELGLQVAPGAWVHVAPSVGGFVGGDHVAALLATEARWSRAHASLLIDIGTNTEISLIHGGRIHSASCPSGPALEGGHISCGMRAAQGAIERVRATAHGLQCDTIGACEPVGLCGSGVIDALAACYGAGILDARGRILLGHAAVREEGSTRSVVLAPGVSVTQDDVRAVQLAKAAIRAATELLLERAGLEAHALERVIIAGAFGAYISIPNAIAIGLLPALPVERVEQVGNAAGVGARRLLQSRAQRAHASLLARRCEYVELSSLGQFQARFLSCIGFPAQGAPRSVA